MSEAPTEWRLHFPDRSGGSGDRRRRRSRCGQATAGRPFATKRSRAGPRFRPASSWAKRPAWPSTATATCSCSIGPDEASTRRPPNCSKNRRCSRSTATRGQLIRSWGANMFLVPHGITIDGANNVFLTDVGLQQVFKFSHDGKRIFAVGEPRVGKWDATHFNQPTDIAIRADGSFYVSDGYVNSRVAIFDRNGKWLQEWGKKGAGEGEFSNPHGLEFVPGSTDVIVADRRELAAAVVRSRRHVQAPVERRQGRANDGARVQRRRRCRWCAVPRHPARGLRSAAHRRAQARSRLEDRRRPSASASPAIRCSTPFTILRLAATARFMWPKPAPNGS